MTDADRTSGFYDALIEDDPAELYETAPCGYLSIDEHGRIRKLNRTFTEWTGLGAELVEQGVRFRDLLPVGDRIFYETHFAPSLALSGRVREIAVELIVADGSRLPVLLNAVAHPGDETRSAVTRIAVFDARERRSYEHELVEARRIARHEAERARALAETLQQTLLPPELPDVPGFDLGAAFRPAGDGSVIGGDFYDVFAVGAHRWGIVLGDVCGKGAEAAVITALARYTVRAASISTHRPREVLQVLHDALERSDSNGFCTALLLMVDTSLDEPRSELSAGGHHLPIVLRADGTVAEVGTMGSMLGMLGPPRLHDVPVGLEPGEQLVMFTDGVIEARRGDEFFGEVRLHTLLRSLAGADPQATADAIASAALDFQAGTARDDIAVLVLARRQAGDQVP